ncbi:MAG: peptide ABC transporter substrate-binding protein, partial [Clostridia bacterium]|nr:peptide ABC transporter substrate-binding protein [Clostridia bacterium]
MKKLLAVLLVAVMVFGFAACGEPAAQTDDTTASPDDTTAQTPVDDPDADKPAAEVYNQEIDQAAYNQESWDLYNANLKSSSELYNKALEAKTVAERYALFALSEAKLIGSGMMLPTTTQGGNYAIGRIAPRTSTTTLWGSDEARLYKTIVVDSELPILPAERAEMIAKWNELKGTGTYEAWVKEYLTG